MPPSLGGTWRWVITSKTLGPKASSASRSSSAFWNTPPDNAIGWPPVSSQPCEVDDQIGDSAVEPRPDHARRCTRRARSSTIAREHGAGVDHRRKPVGVDVERVWASRLIDVARQTLQLDRRLGFVCDHLPDAGQRRHRVEQPAHAGGRSAPEPGLELVSQHRALVVAGTPAPGRGPRPTPGPPPTDATAPSGTAAAR